MKKLLLPIAGVMLIGIAISVFLKNSTEVEPGKTFRRKPIATA